MSGTHPMVVTLESCTVDLVRSEVERDGTRTGLTRIELRLLRYLLDRPGRPIGREELLREVWGYSSRTRTRTIENTIRRLRRKIEREPSHPRHIVAQYGQGYRFEPLGIADAVTPSTTNVAPPEDPLVGREEQLAEIQDRLKHTPVVVIVGLPGVGKTRLAREKLARRQRRLQMGGAWLCELGGVTEEEQVVRAVAAVLDVPIAPGSSVSVDTVVRVGRALHRAGPVLVVLDRAESAADVVPALLQQWIPQAPGARFLVTSTVPIHVQGGVVQALGPLAQRDAERLLLGWAQAIRPAFVAAARAEPAVLSELVRRVGALPLAIRMLAARSSLFSPRQLLERLDRPLDVLRDSRAVPSGEDPTIRGAFARAWEPLGPTQRRVLRWCAERPEFTVDEVEADVSPEEPDSSVIDVLQHLRERCLVETVEDAHHALRFRVPPLLREHVLEQPAP